MIRTNKDSRVLGEGQVRTIRLRLEKGESQAKLAREYKVSINTMHRIAKWETYRDCIPWVNGFLGAEEHNDA